ncbi:hypothetical protein PR048_019345 [Dryococelus australis]|uniref:Uncharacterized protein n=1 Tax=Dryococelus australis TaxID=614101 RepID=A0ABQ9H384_9NEOP|nr:hypothetical protein PR048_019345 [Dryococelus australis]
MSNGEGVMVRGEKGSVACLGRGAAGGGVMQGEGLCRGRGDASKYRYVGNTARLARRSDEALGVHLTVARTAPSLLDLGRGRPSHSRRTSRKTLPPPTPVTRGGGGKVDTRGKRRVERGNFFPKKKQHIAISICEESLRVKRDAAAPRTLRVAHLRPAGLPTSSSLLEPASQPPRLALPAFAPRNTRCCISTALLLELIFLTQTGADIADDKRERVRADREGARARRRERERERERERRVFVGHPPRARGSSRPQGAEAHLPSKIFLPAPMFWPACVAPLFWPACSPMMVCPAFNCSSVKSRLHSSEGLGPREGPFHSGTRPGYSLSHEWPRWCSAHTTLLIPGRAGIDYRRGCSRIFARWNRAGQCRWSVGFPADLPSLPAFAIRSQDLDVKSRPDFSTPFCLTNKLGFPGNSAGFGAAPIPRPTGRMIVLWPAVAFREKGRPMRVIEVSMEQRRNEGAGETGDPRENPPTSGAVRHDSHLR